MRKTLKNVIISKIHSFKQFFIVVRNLVLKIISNNFFTIQFFQQWFTVVRELKSMNSISCVNFPFEKGRKFFLIIQRKCIQKK